MDRTTCVKCCKKHEGKFLSNMGICYGCGKSGHQLKDYRIRMPKRMKSTQDPTNNTKPDASKKNCFYALRSRGDKEESPDNVTGII